MRLKIARCRGSNHIYQSRVSPNNKWPYRSEGQYSYEISKAESIWVNIEFSFMATDCVINMLSDNKKLHESLNMHFLQTNIQNLSLVSHLSIKYCWSDWIYAWNHWVIFGLIWLYLDFDELVWIHYGMAYAFFYRENYKYVRRIMHPVQSFLCVLVGTYVLHWRIG